MEADVDLWGPAWGKEAAAAGLPIQDKPGKDAANIAGRAGAEGAAAPPPQGPAEPAGAWQGLCSWPCWRQRALEHLEQAAESPARIAQVAFEDVAVYFSPEEWAELTLWQRDLYWAVMKASHELVASLGSGTRLQPEAQAGPGGQPGGRAQPGRAGPDACGPPAAEAAPCVEREERPRAPPEELRDAPARGRRDCGRGSPERDSLPPHEPCAHPGQRALPSPQGGEVFGGPSALAAHRSGRPPPPGFTCMDCQSHFVYAEPEASRIHAQLALGKLFRCLGCSCRVALLVGQEPGMLQASLPFGPLDALYYSHQEALEQVRQRAAHWTTRETEAFVELWGDDRVQTALYDNYRNEAQYRRLSDKMGKMGFHRNLEQCRQRAKDLRRGFKEINGGDLLSNRARQAMPFFSLLDRFLLMRRGLVVPRVCAGRARQRGWKEEPPGQPPLALVLPPTGPDLRQQPFPGQEPRVRVAGLPSCRSRRSQRSGSSQGPALPGYRLPSSAQAAGGPCFLLEGPDESPHHSPHPLELADLALPGQDREASPAEEPGGAPGHGKHRDVALAPVNGRLVAGNFWTEIPSPVPAQRPAGTAAQGSAQTWRPGKAPSSSARRMRDLRLRRRRQRAAVARVLLGTSYRPSDRTVWSKTQETDWWDNLAAGQRDDAEWVRCFRMSRAAVLDLAERLRPVLRREDTNMRAAIPVEKRVALTLWKLASADSYRSVARRFGVGVSTASVIVMEVCEAIRAVLLRHVVRLGDAQAVMEGFARAGFPNCIGAADETHIPILCSPHGASAYVSGKGLVSMVLQALVDSAGRFTDVYAGWSGGMRAAGLPWGSPLFEQMERGAFGPQTTTEIGGVPMGPVLLGGPACPLRPWLMTPFPAARTRRQERFNARLRRCHAPAAHAFGRLKGRWRCLLKRLDVAERNVPLVVVACCVLHNLCERRGEAMQGGWEEGLERAAPGGPAGGCPGPEEAGAAHAVREAYCTFFEERPEEEEEQQ
ncbi:uncharacterized protein LOC123019560 [Varanus komodoensis]|uniref:uncharacterized protein LOC123019560 n=1 Tax=Varanus komodoensis TaxID=61221 RepID=UPI001CF792D4|nr:uncharacterized protein LOC123019560 [Varanus komodoensis]